MYGNEKTYTCIYCGGVFTFADVRSCDNSDDTCICYGKECLQRLINQQNGFEFAPTDMSWEELIKEGGA